VFLRKKKNKSGSVSVQIITKAGGSYKVFRTIGNARSEQDIAALVFKGKHELSTLQAQHGLFVFENDALIEGFLSQLANSQIRTIGPELIFGRIYDAIGFGAIREELFRHLVISRLAFPLSKLKTVDYLFRFQAISIDITHVYRFLDKLNDSLKEQVELISFQHTTDNVKALKENGYEYILGGKIKSESAIVKKQILETKLRDGQTLVIKKDDATNLIVAYSSKRAGRDEHNRKRGLQRLEKQVKTGKLTKNNINNRGYNKYLKLKSTVEVEIDYEKFNADKKWDGLKGYMTNTKLKPDQIIENYRNLWHIEKAFRMSKTDLRVRPIYHRLRNRIEAHICISFTAYTIYKELERVLHESKSALSVKKAAELTHNIYEIVVTLPESKETRRILLKLSEEQEKLKKLIDQNY
jgi:hypothetical protein